MACVSCFIGNEPSKCSTGSDHGMCRACRIFCEGDDIEKPSAAHDIFLSDDLAVAILLLYSLDDTDETYLDSITPVDRNRVGLETILDQHQTPLDNGQPQENLDAFVWRYFTPKLWTESYGGDLVAQAFLVWGYFLLLCPREEKWSTQSIQLAVVISNKVIFRLNQLFNSILKAAQQQKSDIKEKTAALSLLRIILTHISRYLDDNLRPICVSQSNYKNVSSGEMQRFNDDFTVTLGLQVLEMLKHVKHISRYLNIYCIRGWQDILKGDLGKAIRDMRSGRVNIQIKRQEKVSNTTLDLVLKLSYIEPGSIQVHNLSQRESQVEDTYNSTSADLRRTCHSKEKAEITTKRKAPHQHQAGKYYEYLRGFQFQVLANASRPRETSPANPGSSSSSLAEPVNNLLVEEEAGFDSWSIDTVSNKPVLFTMSNVPPKIPSHDHHGTQRLAQDQVATAFDNSVYRYPITDLSTAGWKMGSAPSSRVGFQDFPNQVFVAYEGNNNHSLVAGPNKQAQWNNPRNQIGGFRSQFIGAAPNPLGFPGPFGEVENSIGNLGGGFGSVGASLEDIDWGYAGHWGLTTPLLPYESNFYGWNSMNGVPYMEMPPNTQGDWEYQGLNKRRKRANHVFGRSIQKHA